LQITCTVSHVRGLVTVAGTTLAETKPPAAPPPSDEPAAPATPPEPGEVVFNTPTDGETEVGLEAPIRLQFSRGLNPASLAGQVRVSYFGEVPPEVPAIEFKSNYDAANRALEIRFARPLDRFRTIRVELLDGIRTFDGAPITPFTLTYSLGGG
jgi:hypothetical protein